MPRAAFHALLSLAFCSFLAPVLGAQTEAPTRATRVPVTIALSDRTPPGSRFVVERIPTGSRRDVIALRSDATAAELSEAIDAILTARQAEGDVPKSRRTLRVRPTGLKPAARKEYPWVARVLADLQSADEIIVPGIGKARAVEIWLPSQTRPASRP